MLKHWGLDGDCTIADGQNSKLEHCHYCSYHSKSVVSSIDHIIQYCKELMSELDITNIVFVKDSLNSVSYSLISLSKHVGHRTWLGSLPTQFDTNAAVTLIFIS